MKRILCFGDSNTWGHNPADGSQLERPWPVDLAKITDGECEIIFEGLCGRTTHMNVPDDYGKNGMTYFKNMLETSDIARNTDLLIVMLGTNDVLKYFDCEAAESAEAIAEYVRAWREAGGTDALIISPIHIKECSMSHPLFKDLYTAKSAKKSLEFAAEYKKTAEREHAYFMDAARFAEASDTDGIHMEPSEHEKLAAAVAEKVRTILFWERTHDKNF